MKAVDVTLQDVLDNRDQRVLRQNAALAKYERPIVSLTIIMPGPVKDNETTRYLMQEAVANLREICGKRRWAILDQNITMSITGSEAIFTIDAPAEDLKQQLISLEDEHPLGRLWDLDVIAPDRVSFSRTQLGFSGRKCLVCDEPAFACGRSRNHSLDELLGSIRDRIDAFRQA